MPLSNGISDEILMEQVKYGKRAALALLFDRYKLPLYQFFCYQKLDAPAAEDLVQTVFERMLRYCQSYREGSAVKTWVYQIARNTVKDHWKKFDNQPVGYQKLRIDGQLTIQLAVAAEADADVEQKESLTLLQAALERLSAEQREILVLARLERMPYKELALVLGCTESAVKVKVHRALQELRKWYFKLERI